MITWNIVVPANTTATIHVPTTDVSKVTESGKSAAKATGVRFQRMEGTNAVFLLESGNYHFSAPARKARL